MKLNQYNTWKVDAVTYWETEIDLAVEANQTTLGYTDIEKEQMRTDLKSSLNVLMDSYDPKVSSYENDSSKRDEFVGILLSVGTYVTCKDIIATPEAPVETIPILSTGDLRDLFAWWLEDIPDYTTLFTITIEMVNPNPEDPASEEELVYSLDTNAPYSTFLNDLDGYSSDDLSRFNSVNQQAGSSQRNRAAYLLFAGPEAVVVRSEKDLNTTILIDYHAQEILDKFGWIIKGLNS